MYEKVKEGLGEERNEEATGCRTEARRNEENIHMVLKEEMKKEMEGNKEVVMKNTTRIINLRKTTTAI